MLRVLFGLICCLGIHTYTVAQQKFEKESRIKVDEVPESAKQFIGNLQVKGKVKWYLEESLEGTSIEAKFKRNAEKYSVEFSPSGEIQDVEIEIKQKAIASDVYAKIDEALKATFSSYKLIKIQKQLIGEQTNLLNALQQQVALDSITKNFEIVLKGVNEEGRKWYEYTFSEEGELLDKSVIIFRNTDNLEY